MIAVIWLLVLHTAAHEPHGLQYFSDPNQCRAEARTANAAIPAALRAKGYQYECVRVSIPETMRAMLP